MDSLNGSAHAHVAAELARLEELYLPALRLIDLTVPLFPSSVTPSDPAGDADEREKDRSSLLKLIRRTAVAMDELGDESEGYEGLEETLERASALLASLSGHGAAGPRTQIYRLPFVATSIALLLRSELSALTTIDLVIKETTLLASSTGFRTWGSATLLAELVGKESSTFLPSLRLKSEVQGAMSTGPRVLELGSGTGLVGIMAATVLLRSGTPSLVQLTDFENLENLRHNVNCNLPPSPLSRVVVKQLDWRAYYDRRRMGEVEKGGRFDLILGADLVYEPLHLPWLHATVSALLAFPEMDQATPVFHLLLPLRPTHTAESSEFELAFSPHLKVTAEYPQSIDGAGRKWRLTTRRRRDFSGEDGFGSLEEARETRYWLYEIIWCAR